MIKHFYFIDPNGEFYSADGTVRYRLEVGKKGALTARRKRETEDVRFTESIDGEILSLMESGETDVKDYRKQERREQYVRDSKNEYNPIILSLDNIREEEGEELSYHEIIASDYDLEEEVLMSEKLAILRKSLSALNKEERQIIHDLFFEDAPMTEREYARSKGIPQKTMNNRKIAIFKKMRKFFKNVGSN